jgi:aminoglycoside 6'-N-acetyltransferase I
MTSTTRVRHHSLIPIYMIIWPISCVIFNRDHPTAFYQKLGFQIVGVMPDANGIGKPDIIMAKDIKER